ncbi:glycosyltransferase family 2 protein [Galbitalea sp. SE-J8]|uniref:glycosyltransferase family 2 protein n=1 Tax=Galbitalea sp. SE-J8 TaxID=3054952 RepID=UPI00259CB107|nr:glycosyltransferase family 2 protein [Galbitalea sp. SE-J8]MDM4763923.1 glycosyltransferase family 2 protein [Galbitalea sp. SE-J8]
MFSVVIPAYRADLTIRRAILSARECGATEIIVVEDGSVGATREIVADLGARYEWQENRGAYWARLTGAKLCTMEFLVFLDADDEMVPGGVIRNLEKLRRDHNISVAAGTVIGVDANGGEHQFPVRYRPVDTESLLRVGFGPWPPGAAMIRRSALEDANEVSPDPIETRYADDYQLLIRLSRTGTIAVSDAAACRYSLAGGKSARSAFAAISAKEAIRAHYAGAWNIPVELMSSRAIRSASDARRARANWAEHRWARAALLMARSAMLDLPRVARSARRRTVFRLKNWRA